MNLTKKISFSKLLLIPFFSFSQKQNLKKIELDLLKASDKLFSFYQPYKSDSLDKYSEQLRNQTIEALSKNPGTLKYPFQMLIDSNAFEIVTSEDSLFRIYSWDTWTGGTMHFFNNIFQYSNNGKVTTELLELTEDDPSGFYSDIFTLRSADKTFYLVINNGMYSTKDVVASIQVFTIEKGKLNQNVKLIKTSSAMTSMISVEFDFFSVVDRPERPVRVIKYDKNKKIIYIPVVYEDGKVTDKFIQYKFNGKYFEKYKIE
jgi:hypothetical protein